MARVSGATRWKCMLEEDSSIAQVRRVRHSAVKVVKRVDVGGVAVTKKVGVNKGRRRGAQSINEDTRVQNGIIR